MSGLMCNNSKFSTKHKKAFSLVELMIVIVIISILTGFAALEVRNDIKRAQEETLKKNLKALRQQIDNFYADRGYYPNNLDDLTKGRYPYFAVLPEDPSTKLADWQVRPPKLNIAINVKDQFVQQPAPDDYAHASASSSYATNDAVLTQKFTDKNNSVAGNDWLNQFNSQVKALANYNEIYGKVLDEEIFSNGIFNAFITSLKSKTNFYDIDTDDTNPLSEEAYAIVYDDAANLVRASPAQAIDGDLKTSWITEEGVRDAWFKIDLPEDPKISDYVKVDSIIINFKPPANIDSEYRLYEVKLHMASDLYIIQENPDTGKPLIANKGNNYIITIENPFKEDVDRIAFIQFGIKAYGGSDPRPAISEVIIFKAPYEKPLPTDTVFSDYRWDVWRKYNPPGGVYNVKSNNPSYYDW